MGILTFDLKAVNKLVDAIKEHQANGGLFSPTMDMLFDGNCYPGGKPLDKDGNTEKTSKLEFFWPSPEHMKPEAKIPCLQIAGDHGVYIITNITSSQTPSESGLIVYAEGCNPDKDEDWYEEKASLFGGDDGSATIPIEWVDLANKKGGSSFVVQMTSQNIRLKI